MTITENVAVGELGEVQTEGEQWRQSTSSYKKYVWVRDLMSGDIMVSKQRLLNTAIGFFTEARMTCDSALNAMRDLDRIREDRYE